MGEYASLHHLSLFAAAFEGDFQREINNRQLEDLLTFCQFINKLQDRAARDPAGEILNDMLSAIQYETFLYDTEESRSAETKWKNLQDFVGWLTRKGTGNGEAEEEKACLI